MDGTVGQASDGGGSLLGGVLQTSGNAVLGTSDQLSQGPAGGATSPVTGGLDMAGTTLTNTGASLNQNGVAGIANGAATPLSGVANVTAAGQPVVGDGSGSNAAPIGLSALSPTTAPGTVASVGALNSDGGPVTVGLPGAGSGGGGVSGVVQTVDSALGGGAPTGTASPVNAVVGGQSVLTGDSAGAPVALSALSPTTAAGTVATVGAGNTDQGLTVGAGGTNVVTANTAGGTAAGSSAAPLVGVNLNSAGQTTGALASVGALTGGQTASAAIPALNGTPSTTALLTTPVTGGSVATTSVSGALNGLAAPTTGAGLTGNLLKR